MDRTDRLKAKITEVERRIRKLETDRARFQGVRDQALERLKKEFGLSTVDEAFAKCSELDEEMATLDKELSGIEREIDILVAQSEGRDVPTTSFPSPGRD